MWDWNHNQHDEQVDDSIYIYQYEGELSCGHTTII